MMRVCCYRVFVDGGELWDCLLVVKQKRRYQLYTSVDQLPGRMSDELRALLWPNGTRRPELPPAATVVDANRLERVIKSLDGSDTFKRSVVRDLSDASDAVVSVNNNNVAVGVNDIVLVTPSKYRLSYTWCEIYEKTDIEYRELENTMAWLSTLGGAFSSLGDQTEHCAIVAGKISQQQLRIALRLGDPLTAVRCKLYAAISLMQRGLYKQSKSIVRSQYMFVKSQLSVDDRLIKMCFGIWTKLRYERNRNKILNSSNTI